MCSFAEVHISRALGEKTKGAGEDSTETMAMDVATVSPLRRDGTSSPDIPQLEDVSCLLTFIVQFDEFCIAYKEDHCTFEIIII